ncbi:MAG: formyltransferase family protein [Pseudomonadota bacterium]
MTSRRRIIFLCGEAEGEAFREHVESISPGFETQWVGTAASLDFATKQDTERTRLISFLTDVIVPGEIIERLGLTPYNIHPGSPEFPGAHGLNFAIFEEATSYGVTVHEMTPSVDTGPIVLTERFPLPPGSDLLTFGDQVFRHAISLADRVICHAVETDDPLPRAPDLWSGPQRTKAKFTALLTSADYLLPHDRERLARAAGPHLKRYQKAHRSYG